MGRMHVNLKKIAAMGTAVLTETGEDARPDLSGKPNRSLVLWGMQDKTKEVFGVEDMTELFDDFGASYRMEYEERYGAEQ